MVLETEVFFFDETEPELRPNDYSPWAKMSIELSTVFAISEYIEDGEIVPDQSQISIMDFGTWTIRTPYKKLKPLWDKSRNELKFALN